VVEFRGNVRLLGVFLQGQYLVVHDHDLMARGEDCTYVYKLEPGKPDKLVVSFTAYRWRGRRQTISRSRLRFSRGS
jgi:hypothetical protein